MCLGFLHRRRALAAVLAVALLPLPLRVTQAHPLHTTVTEITCGRGGAVRVKIRVFSDDFARAVQRASVQRVSAARGVAPNDAAAYVARTFRLRDKAGTPVRLTLRTLQPEGEVTWLAFDGIAAGGLTGGKVVSGLLFELFDDQVNIVKSKCGRPFTTLFSKGDPEAVIR